VRLHHLVTYEDGSTVEVKTGPADVVAWETEHGRSFGKALEDGYAAWMYWLAWHALTRKHGETRTFEEWLNEVASSDDVPPPAADATPPGETGEAPPDS
jgi:hypothetical protein